MLCAACQGTSELLRLIAGAVAQPPDYRERIDHFIEEGSAVLLVSKTEPGGTDRPNDYRRPPISRSDRTGVCRDVD